MQSSGATLMLSERTFMLYRLNTFSSLLELKPDEDAMLSYRMRADCADTTLLRLTMLAECFTSMLFWEAMLEERSGS